MRKIKNTKYFTWHIAEQNVTIHVNSRTDIVVKEGDVMRANYYIGGYSGVEILNNGNWISINSKIARKIFDNYMRFYKQDFLLNYYQINIKPFTF